jgi:hypothetical protein
MLNRFANLRIVGGISTQQAAVAGQHHVAVGDGQVRLDATFN